MGLHHDDGTPPYDVRWSDTERISLFFPGPDTRIQHLNCPAGAGPARTIPPAEA